MAYKKYKNKKAEIDGIKFDSKKEAERYLELKILEQAGEIKDLRLQVKFELVPKQADERSLNYYADFVYYDTAKEKKVIEDTKGFKTDLYIAKRKLVKYKYPDYEFLET